MSIATEHGRVGRCTVQGPDGDVLAEGATFLACVRPDGGGKWRLAMGDVSMAEAITAIAQAAGGWAVMCMAGGLGLGEARDLIGDAVDAAVMQAGREVARVGRDKAVQRR